MRFALRSWGVLVLVVCGVIGFGVGERASGQGDPCQGEPFDPPCEGMVEYDPAVDDPPYLIPVSVKLTHNPGTSNAMLYTEALIQEAFNDINTLILDRWDGAVADIPWRFRTPVEVIDLSNVRGATGFPGDSVLSAVGANPTLFARRGDAVNVYIVEKFSTSTTKVGNALPPMIGDGGGAVVVAQMAEKDIADNTANFVVSKVSPSVTILHEMGHYFSLPHLFPTGTIAAHGCFPPDAPPQTTFPICSNPLSGSGVCVSTPIPGVFVEVPELNPCVQVPHSGACDWMNGNAMHEDNCADPEDCTPCTDCTRPECKVTANQEQIDNVSYELLVPDALRSHLLMSFVRGDCQGDGVISTLDVIYLLNYLNLGGASPDCEDACDADDSGDLTFSDAAYMFDHAYNGGPPPPSPYPACGLETTFDALSCELYGCP